MLVKYHQVTAESLLADMPFDAGSIYFCLDTKYIFLDPIGETDRIPINSDHTILFTEVERENIIAPIPGRVYIVLESGSLYIYSNNNWNHISDNTKMNKNNPTGTGSFSLNRKADTDIGNYSHAEGYNNTASGNYSHAEGSSNISSGEYSHTEGRNTKASSKRAHAEGTNTTASGESSHAEGMSTTSSGLSSHAEGNQTESSGSNSHAEGDITKASGNESHAEGFNTKASGGRSHAEGDQTESYGANSHAEGYNTKAYGDNSHVQGKYNIIDRENKYVHIVGNGTDETYSNAHTIDWNGLGWFAGGLKIGGTGQDDTSAEDVAKKKNSIFYIVGDSTTAGTWTGTHEDITKYYDGLTIAYKTNIAGISGGSTLNINGLGAIDVVRNTTTAITTHYEVGSILILTYTTDSDKAYWKIADYDSDTKTRSSNKSGSKMFIIGATTQSSNGQTTYSNSKCYIGTDNCLYSNGAKVTTAADVNTLIDTKLESIAVAEEMSF